PTSVLSALPASLGAMSCWSGCESFVDVFRRTSGLSGTGQMPGSFFDSNVLLYLASGDRAKADRAEDLVRAGGVISVQVLSEVANVARRKMRLSWAETREFLAMIRSLLAVQGM